MPTKENTKNQMIKDWILDILIVGVLALGIRHFIFTAYQVNGPSMCPTFNLYENNCLHTDGERIISSRFPTWSLGPWSLEKYERGDVIVFKHPYSKDHEFLIKRIMGIPGDEIKIQDGYVYRKIDGSYQPIHESYLNEENLGNTISYGSRFSEFQVPEGKYLVFGDNRVQSNDSRRCFKSSGCDPFSSPFIEEEAIQGIVHFVFFPLSHSRVIHNPFNS